MATFPIPVETGVAIEFGASADWLDTPEGGNALDLVPAIMQAFSFALTDVAAASLTQIGRAQAVIRSEESGYALAEALGLAVDGGEMSLMLDTDQLAEYLANANSLPFELEWEIPVLQIYAGRDVLTVVVTLIQLSEGSLINKIGTAVRSHPFLSLLIALSVPSAGTMAATEGLDHWRNRQAIERVISGSPCRTNFDFRINAAEIRELAAKQLDWENPPQGEDEHAVICRLQYSLLLAGEYPGPIDGIRGDDTNAALQRFINKQQLQNYRPKDAIVLGQLATVASRASIRYS